MTGQLLLRSSSREGTSPMKRAVSATSQWEGAGRLQSWSACFIFEGSSSCPNTSSAAALAQLGELQTEDLKVPGSIPGLGICM